MPDLATLTAYQIGIQASVPMLLEGVPGVAKSSLTEGTARKLGWHSYTLIPSHLDPSEINGIPIARADKEDYVLASPEWAKLMYAAIQNGKRALLFMDELNLAKQSVQAACLRLVQERWCGRLYLGPQMSVASAINPDRLGTGATSLGSSMANRWCRLFWDHKNPRLFIDGLKYGFKDPDVTRVPDGWDKALGETYMLLASYMETRGDQAVIIPEDDDKIALPYPTWRSWTNAAKLAAAAKAAGHGYGSGVALMLVQGCVGPAGGEWLNWVTKLDLPDPETLLANPGSLRLPKRGDVAMAICCSVSSAVINRPTPEVRWHQAWDVLAEANRQGHGDIAYQAVIEISKNQPKHIRPPKSAEDFYDLMVQSGIIPSSGKA